MAVVLYIEGTGDDASFRRFLEKVPRFNGKNLTTLLCDGADDTYGKFLSGLKDSPEDNAVLLVDSGAYVNVSHSYKKSEEVVWDHLDSRPNNKMAKPATQSYHQVFLMVQEMEHWILGDLRGLRNYYNRYYKQVAEHSDIENLSGDQAFSLLKELSSGRYNKGQVSFRVLENLEPQVIEQNCPSFAHFLRCLEL